LCARSWGCPEVKPAFQKDDVFLAEVRKTLKAGDRRIWWLGQSGFFFVQNGRAILLDPYLSDSLTKKYANTDKPHTRITERVVDPAALGKLGVIELITSSHNHTDHLDAETLIPLLKANPRTRLAVPAANTQFVLERIGAEFEPRLVAAREGHSLTLADIEITGIPSAHPAIERDSNGRCRCLGYVISWAGFTLYHSGDTLLHPGLVAALQRFSVDLALLPINGDRPERRVAGNLDGPQAARLAREIKARCVIPCHFDLFGFNTASPDDFSAECRRLNQPFQILQNGQGLTVSIRKTES
jgi:L-ascorbate metabolism protein UlaG (beta-lactamase superfamily)